MSDTTTLLDQAIALLAQTHAQAGESFRELTPDAQDLFLCAVSDLVSRARDAVADA
ncbi:hypothetical protein [Acidovorax carolinensis]|uniref:hypothetical protein n=1 Tax=Acidovorax carolinensis TaxID=553814 RepID=UPI0012FF7E68|nr:hypothetical protein [Acidovorax carolinensis]